MMSARWYFVLSALSALAAVFGLCLRAFDVQMWFFPGIEVVYSICALIFLRAGLQGRKEEKRIQRDWDDFQDAAYQAAMTASHRYEHQQQLLYDPGIEMVVLNMTKLMEIFGLVDVFDEETIRRMAEEAILRARMGA